jgi:hypothetical protein
LAVLADAVVHHAGDILVDRLALLGALPLLRLASLAALPHALVRPLVRLLVALDGRAAAAEAEALAARVEGLAETLSVVDVVAVRALVQ